MSARCVAMMVLSVVRADRFATLLSFPAVALKAAEPSAEGLGEVVCPYGWPCQLTERDGKQLGLQPSEETAELHVEPHP